MEFQFQERPALEIRGRRYEADLSDVGFLEAVVTDFSAILREYEELARAREKLSADRLRPCPPRNAATPPDSLPDAAKDWWSFRAASLKRRWERKPTPLRSAGEGRTVPSISGSVPISMRRAAKGREKVVNRYVLRDKPVQRGKRTPTKPAGGRKKGAD